MRTSRYRTAAQASASVPSYEPYGPLRSRRTARLLAQRGVSARPSRSHLADALGPRSRTMKARTARRASGAGAAATCFGVGRVDLMLPGRRATRSSSAIRSAWRSRRTATSRPEMSTSKGSSSWRTRLRTNAEIGRFVASRTDIDTVVVTELFGFELPQSRRSGAGIGSPSGDRPVRAAPRIRLMSTVSARSSRVWPGRNVSRQYREARLASPEPPGSGPAQDAAGDR